MVGGVVCRVAVAATVWMAISVAAPSPGFAHEAEATRSLVLQVDAEGIAGLWDVVQQGKRAALQVAMFDLDRDKKLSGFEKAALAGAFVERGMAGVRIQAGTTVLRPAGSITARLVEDAGRDKSIEAVGLVSYEVTLAGERRWIIEIAVAEGYGNLAVQLQTLGPWRLAGAEFSKLAEDRRGLAAPKTILPGGSLRFEIERGREKPQMGAKAGGNR